MISYGSCTLDGTAIINYGGAQPTTKTQCTKNQMRVAKVDNEKKMEYNEREEREEGEKKTTHQCSKIPERMNEKTPRQIRQPPAL